MILLQRVLDADRGRGHAGGRGRNFPLVSADVPQVGRDRRPEVTRETWSTHQNKVHASSVFPQVRQPGDDRPVDVHQRAAAGEGDRGGLRQALLRQQLSRVGRQGHGGHANRELGTYIFGNMFSN